MIVHLARRLKRRSEYLSTSTNCLCRRNGNGYWTMMSYWPELNNPDYHNFLLRNNRGGCFIRTNVENASDYTRTNTKCIPMGSGFTAVIRSGLSCCKNRTKVKRGTDAWRWRSLPTTWLIQKIFIASASKKLTFLKNVNLIIRILL